jgi:uncharacterized protein (DUF1778 family)
MRNDYPASCLLRENEEKLIKQASEFSGISLSSFIRQSALIRAREIEQLWKKAESGNLKVSDIEQHELLQEVNSE